MKSTVGRVPEWTLDRAIYHVSLHLADSVPASEREAWIALRTELAAKAKSESRPLTANESDMLNALYSERVEKYLAAGYGACLLRNPKAADSLLGILEHGNGRDYALHCLAIMPNHLHVIVQFAESDKLRPALEQWKRISSHRINRVFGRNGQVWTNGSYTRIIRTRDEYARQVSYVVANPEVAGLRDGFLVKEYVARV